MDRIHELAEELAKEIRNVFPGFTNGSVNCSDGYINITITKWDEGEEVEATKRRMLFGQSKIGDEWGEDYSQDQNKYLDSRGLLLKY